MSKGIILKIEGEIILEGRVKDLKEIVREREPPTDPESRCLCDIDVFMIMMLYHQEPSTSLRGYINGLYSHTRTLIC